MTYKVTIVRIDEDVKYTYQSWKKLRDDEEKDPSGENRTYGYVEDVKIEDEETKIFEQRVDDLKLSAVVAVINGIVPELK